MKKPENLRPFMKLATLTARHSTKNNSITMCKPSSSSISPDQWIRKTKVLKQPHPMFSRVFYFSDVDHKGITKILVGLGQGEKNNESK
ncbi:MAG: hypothetical protein JXR70_05530 [Spirochaetales bacterium]|nr:hypothetical protein [Spirochaetales bacterium]